MKCSCCTICAFIFGDRKALICATRKSRILSIAYRGQSNSEQRWHKHTLWMRFSSNGLRSLIPLMSRDSFTLPSSALALLSTSARARTHASSIGPSTIFLTTVGARLISSTTGPRPLSTTFLFSNLTLRAVDRACKVSISADTAARSLRKLAKLISTEFRMSSQAKIDLWRSSNFSLSFSSSLVSQNHGCPVHTYIHLSFAGYMELWTQTGQSPAPIIPASSSPQNPMQTHSPHSHPCHLRLWKSFFLQAPRVFQERREDLPHEK